MGNPRNKQRKPKRRKRKAQSTAEGRTAKRQKSAENISTSTTQTPSRPSQDPLAQSSSNTDESPISTSASKLEKAMQDHEKKTESDQEEIGFVLFDCSILQSVFGTLCCPECKSESLKFEEVREQKKGFCVFFLLRCGNCPWQNNFTSSNRAMNSRMWEVNGRAVLAFRNIGVRYEKITDFSKTMNMQKPMTRNNYDKLIDSVHAAYMKEAEKSMKNAVEEVKEKTDSCDFVTSFDGTWQKPGHASLNGVVTAIANNSGKAIDFEVKSKKCKACETRKHLDKNSNEYRDWYTVHQHECCNNHTGSSGAMEVAGIKDMYARSEEKYGVRYTVYVGDGDSSSYSTIANAKPYGPDIDIVKKECVGHVQKRLGTRLRKLKVSLGKKKLKDGKGIAGKGRLTNKLIDKMQNYYGLAIRQNPQDLNGMQNDIKAGLYHIASSESKPQHDMCPEGKDSWCGWQQDKANDTHTYKHKNSLPEAIVDEVQPIYDDLSKEALLSRCLDCYTQNANEALNHLIWARCSKKSYQGKKVVELCTASAVTYFNDGASSVFSVLERLGIRPGSNFNAGVGIADRRRVCLAEKFSTDKVKKQRKKLRAIKKGLWDKDKEKEGNVYEAGGH
ncbi:MAG: hypothetical protein GY823_01950 [Flavobacteriaceae bacterium]|nr:hypothetical protein [Flavobacteriaceae bacterium]